MRYGLYITVSLGIILSKGPGIGLGRLGCRVIIKTSVLRNSFHQNPNREQQGDIHITTDSLDVAERGVYVADCTLQYMYVQHALPRTLLTNIRLQVGSSA